MLLLAVGIAYPSATAVARRATAKHAKHATAKHPKHATAKHAKRRRAGTPVPQRFVGVNVGGPLFGTPGVDPAGQFNLMVSSGVQSVRTVFDWSAAQPYRSWAEVPADQKSRFVNVGGVPTDFSATDAVVGLAAQRGLTVLPSVLYAPKWDAGRNHNGGAPPPARTGPYANYLTALIHRYGPHGSFWRSHHPRVAIRAWQIWNEPNLTVYWPQPFAASYVKLLAAAHRAIKHADRGAKVVISAITNVAWKDLAKVYAIHGARRLFDVVSVNGFTSTPKRVVEFLRLVRQAMTRHGDRRKPLLYTEMSWPSAKGQSLEQFDWDTTQSGQARDIASVVPMLAANRKALGLQGFYYYTWIAEEYKGAFNDFNFAGLVRYQPDQQVVVKPALAAFKRGALKIEGCKRKGRLATQCRH
jgi:arabinogalactan endo-1,4-beta-galactosidase